MKKIVSIVLSLAMAVTLMVGTNVSATPTEYVSLTGDQLYYQNATYFSYANASYSVGGDQDDYIGKITFGSKINAQDKGFAINIENAVYADLQSQLSNVFVSKIEYTFSANADINLKPYMSTNAYVNQQMRNPEQNLNKNDYALLSPRGDTFTVRSDRDYTFVAHLNALNKYNSSSEKDSPAKNFVDAWGNGYNYLYLYPQPTDCTELYIKSVKVYYYTVAGTMVSGAGLRVGVHNGIRYFTSLDTDLISEATARGYTVTKGTLIAPVDTLGGEELTFDSPTKVDLPVSGYFSNNEQAETEGVIAGSLTNIKSANIARDFVGRGYIKLQKGEQTITYYAVMNDNER